MAPGSSAADSDVVAERLEKRMASMTDRVWDKVGEIQDELARLRDQEFDHVRRLAERAMEVADQAQAAPLVDVVVTAAVKDQVEPLRSQIDAVAAGLQRTQKTLEEQQERIQATRTQKTFEEQQERIQASLDERQERIQASLDEQQERIQASLDEQIERLQKSLEEQQEQMEDGIAELSGRIRSTEASADSVVKDIELLRVSYKDRWDWENDLGGRVDQLSRRIESCVVEEALQQSEEALQQSFQALRTSVDRQVKDNTSAATELGMRVAQLDEGLRKELGIRVAQLDESLRKEVQRQAESAVAESVSTSKEHVAAEVETFREGMETILLATAANKDAVVKVSEQQNSSQMRISNLQDELCQSVAIHTEHRKRLDTIQEAVDSVAKRLDVADSTQTWVDCCTRQLGQRLDSSEEQIKLARDALTDFATQVAVEQTQSINSVERRCIAAMDARAATISAEMLDRMSADLAGVSRKLTDIMEAKIAAAAERSDAKFAPALERADANLAAAAERLDAKLAAASKSILERVDADRSRCMDELRSAARQADAVLPRLQAAERQLEACSSRADAAESHRVASEQRQEQRLAAQEQRCMAQEQRLAAEEKRSMARESQLAQQERQFLAQEQKFAAQEQKLATQEQKFAAQEHKLAAQERQLASQERQLAGQGQATKQLGDQLAQFPSRVEARIEEARAALRDDMAASTRCALVSAFQGEMRLEAKMSQLSAASTSVSQPAPWESQLGQLLVPPSPAPQQGRAVAGTPPLPPRPPLVSGNPAPLRPPQSPRMQFPQGPAHVAAAALLAGLPGMSVPGTQQLGHAGTARFGLGSVVASEAGSLGG